MPWSGTSFADRHNHSLHGEQATHAAHIANAMLGRGVPEGISIATANKWAQHHAGGGGIAHRDVGGIIDPTQPGVGGVQPSTQTQNPLVSSMIQRYASLPTEKLAELSGMLGASPQGQIIQRLLQQRRTMPQQSQPPQQQPLGGAQQATMRRGGAMPQRAVGGDMGISPAQGSPWWTRSEARGADNTGYLHGPTMGRADAIETTAPGGSHVIPADVISGLGEGNSLAGARVMQGILDSGPHGIPQARLGRGPGLPRPPSGTRMPQFQAEGGATQMRAGGVHGSGQTPVALSHGEFVISPEHVSAWGHGDPELGHRVWDRWIVETRKKLIEKQKKLPTPVGYKKKSA